MTHSSYQHGFFISLLFTAVMALPWTDGLAQPVERTTIGGYGEIHYTEPDGGARGQIDFHRFVLYLSHSFGENISFHSEVELEHTKLVAGEDEGGEIAIEQAYLDWRLAQSAGLRAGIILAPVGIINEQHEPPTFNGVERPNVDRVIIPTTWREAGAGFYGDLSDGIRYQAYLTAGLQASGFSSGSGIRGGRQEGFRSNPVNPSFTGRIDYLPDEALKLGASWFAGNTTGGVDSLGSGTLLLFAADARFRQGPFGFRAVGVVSSLSDADRINRAFMKDVGDRMAGFYAEASYDVMPVLDGDSESVLDLFARYERYNTQAEVTGITADPRNDRDEVTVGATFKPTYNTAFKVDYQFLGNAAGQSGKVLNLGVGYHFN